MPLRFLGTGVPWEVVLEENNSQYLKEAIGHMFPGEPGCATPLQPPASYLHNFLTIPCYPSYSLIQKERTMNRIKYLPSKVKWIIAGVGVFLALAFMAGGTAMAIDSPDTHGSKFTETASYSGGGGQAHFGRERSDPREFSDIVAGKLGLDPEDVQLAMEQARLEMLGEHADDED